MLLDFVYISEHIKEFFRKPLDIHSDIWLFTDYKEGYLECHQGGARASEKSGSL